MHTHRNIHTHEKQEQSVRENIAAHHDPRKGYATENSIGITLQIKNFQTYVLKTNYLVICSFKMTFDYKSIK